MVKPLKDILAEIEERESVRRFYMGGSPDEAQDEQYGGDSFEDDDESYQGEMMEEYTQQYFPDSEEPPPLPISVPREDTRTLKERLEDYDRKQYERGVPGGRISGEYMHRQPPDLFERAEKPFDWASAIVNTGIGLLAKANPYAAFISPFINVDVKDESVGVGPPGAGIYDMVYDTDYGKSWGKLGGTDSSAKPEQMLARIDPDSTRDVPLGWFGTNLPNVQVAEKVDKVVDPDVNIGEERKPPPDRWEGSGESDSSVVQAPTTPTQQIARDIVEVAVTPEDKTWSFDPSTWYPSAQGGPIEAYQVGGLAGMMNRGMMDQRQQFNAQQALQIDQQNALWNKYRGGNRPIHDRPYQPRPPQFGGIGLPRPPGFFDPRPPRQPSQQPRLEPKTYFHEHEGGKVTYPNFPKPFVNPPDDRNPIKDPKRPKPILDQGFLPSVKEQFTTPQLEEAPRPEPYSPLEPVPPISISETTATAMEPEAVEEATQTTIEEARPVPREIDIQMPENVTATLDFPEGVRGTANYRRGGSSSSVEEQLEEDDTVTWEEILNKINSIYDLNLGTSTDSGDYGNYIEDVILKHYFPKDFKSMRATTVDRKDLVEKLQDIWKDEPKLDPKMDDDILEHKGYGIDSREDYDFELPSERKFIEGYAPVARHGGEVPANYRRGGLAGILKSLAPMGLGFLGSMYGNPWLGIGAGSLAGYGMAGKKRSFLDAIKGGLSGYAGTGLAQVGAMGHQRGLTGASKFTTPATPEVAATATSKAIPAQAAGAEKLWEAAGKQLETGAMTFEDVIKGYGNLGKEGLKGFGKAMGAASWPIGAAVGAASLTPPSEMPEFTEVEVAQIQSMTPEQRRAYIEAQRSKYKDSPMMQPTVFAPPNVDIGWQPNYAAEGGVMEIDEEMESGSFVLPADVVSNVGDGSSDSGHRRLTELFGGGDEYAIGGGTGILKGPVKGVGSGLDDLIQTGIDGVRVARLSSDEFVVPKDVVRRLGNGSQKAGSEKLYDFMKDVRLQKHGTGQQPKEIHMSGLRKMV